MTSARPHLGSPAFGGHQTRCSTSRPGASSSSTAPSRAWRLPVDGAARLDPEDGDATGGGHVDDEADLVVGRELAAARHHLAAVSILSVDVERERAFGPRHLEERLVDRRRIRSDGENQCSGDARGHQHEAGATQPGQPAGSFLHCLFGVGRVAQQAIRTVVDRRTEVAEER